MNKELESIISLVKKMPLIEGQWKEINGEIEDEKFIFYKLKDNRNFLFYYFDEIIVEQTDEVNKEKSNEMIEGQTDENRTNSEVAELVVRRAEKYLEKYYGDYVPQDTYVVFLSKVPKHEDGLQKFIIRIEENEFLFKKYVCLYTEDELLELQDILLEVDEELAFWSNKNLISEKKDLNSQLLLRLTIKIPVIALNFAEIKFNSIQNRVITGIKGKEDNENLSELNNKLISWIETDAPETIGELLFKELVGELDEI